MELGLVLLAFIAFLSLPHILFKMSAEFFIDLGRRPDVSEIEEIVAAIAPSLVLNLIAVGIVAVARLMPAVHFPWADWPLIIRVLFADNGGERLAHYCQSPSAFFDPLRYVAVLVIVACASGASYGRAVQLATLTSADEQEFPDVEDLQPQNRWQRMKFGVSKWADRFWSPFYHEYRHQLYPWSELKPYMYVRTIDANIYHGRFVNYNKAKDGGIESIQLEEVTRLRHNRERLIAQGENPLRELSGTLYMKWDRIADINTVSPNHIFALWIDLEAQAQRHRLPTSEQPPAASDEWPE